MSKGTHETEIKLAVPDARSARRLLKDAGFEVTRPRVFESNTIYGSQYLALRKTSRLLRVRTAGSMATLTYKGAPTTARHKSREELEVTVSSAATTAAIVERLGLHPTFRYEKYRTEFGQPRRSGMVVLDETPIGVYLELEGSPHWIDRTARRLGFTDDDYITASYGRLYLEWCRRTGRKPNNMIF